MQPHRIALVTGASSGIGKAIADYLDHKDLKVFGASRNPTRHARIGKIKMDVMLDASVQEGVDELINKVGRIDVLVHCAGIALLGPLEDTSLDDAEHQMNTNFLGTVRVCKAVIPWMRKQRSGKIVLMGSLSGMIGLPFMSIYSASKFALQGFTEAFRMEVARFGVQVCVVNPGDVNTPIVDHHIYAQDEHEDNIYGDSYCHMRERYENGVRKGTLPQEVAERVWSVLNAKQPKVCYPVGNAFELFATYAKQVLPSRLFEKLFQWVYGLAPLT